MNGYEVKVYYNSDDQCYVAQIVEFVGCAVDGETASEALNNLYEAKEAWIKDMLAQGHAIPPPKYASAQASNQYAVTA